MADGGLRAARILGSGGFIPTDRRETSCLLVRGDDPARALVVDAGTGIRRLVTDPALVDGVRVTVWGPGAANDGRPTEEILGGVYRAPVFPLEKFVDEVRELEPGETEIGGIAVRARRQERHADPTMGLRLGDRLVWCTDTAYDEATAGFARGAEVLCHDAWGFGQEPDETASHTTAAQAARIAS